MAVFRDSSYSADAQLTATPTQTRTPSQSVIPTQTPTQVCTSAVQAVFRVVLTCPPRSPSTGLWGVFANVWKRLQYHRLQHSWDSHPVASSPLLISAIRGPDDRRKSAMKDRTLLSSILSYLHMPICRAVRTTSSPRSLLSPGRPLEYPSNLSTSRISISPSSQRRVL